MAAIRQALDAGIAALDDATQWVVGHYGSDIADVLAGASHYLRLTGYVVGNYLLARAALSANRQLARREGDPAFLEAKIVTARFFADTLLPQGTALLGPLKTGGRTTMALQEMQF
jgi:hypothetical protein